MKNYKMIAAMSQNRVIGFNNGIPWFSKQDLHYFRTHTINQTVVMGRKTWESLGKPLRDRRNIILSRTLEKADGAEIIRNPEDLFKLKIETEVWIIGGSEIYTLFEPYCEELFLTVVDTTCIGDTFFPNIEEKFGKMKVVDTDKNMEWRKYSRDALSLKPLKATVSAVLNRPKASTKQALQGYDYLKSHSERKNKLTD